MPPAHRVCQSPPRHLRFRPVSERDVLPEALTSVVSVETLFVLAAYAVLGGLYLVVVPLALFFWMNKRWHQMGKVERLGIYGMVFLFFPGMIVFAPFLNLRLQGQGEV